MQKHSIARAIAGARWNPLDGLIGSDQGLWLDPSDMSTMFQDAAGTIPVTDMEQPVGLMLDKRNTAHSVYFDGTGDYLSLPTNQSGLAFGSGDFTVEAWVYRSSGTGTAVIFLGQSDLSSIAGSAYVFYVGSNVSALYSGGGGSYTIASPSPKTGYWAHVAYVRNGGTFSSYLNGVLVGTRADLGSLSINAGLTNKAPAIGATAIGTSALNGYISNLRIVKGTALYTTNFTPPTAPLQPVAGTSLLTCGTSWSGNPALIIAGNTRADGSNPFVVGAGNHAFQSTSANRPTLSAKYNLLTGTESLGTQTVTTQATSYRLTFSGTGTIALSESSVLAAVTAGTYTFSAAAGSLVVTVVGSVTQVDLRATNDTLGQPAYQRVNTSADYDTAGFKPYLLFNGTNSSMQTAAINFTGTDRVFTCVGVRKLNSADSILVELSQTASTNTSIFNINTYLDTFYYTSKGTVQTQHVVSGYHAPTTRVMSFFSDISDDLVTIRSNGTPQLTATADQGSGNYGNYPLYIGARAGNAFWFNGHLYQLIICGKPTSVPIDQITRTEQFVNNKTKAY